MEIKVRGRVWEGLGLGRIGLKGSMRSIGRRGIGGGLLEGNWIDEDHAVNLRFVSDQTTSVPRLPSDIHERTTSAHKVPRELG